jgi:uroporphyrinogen decarboxylase
VSDVGDWEALEPLDVNSGEFGRQVRAVELISGYAQDKVPTMATLFDSAMVADKLCDSGLMTYISQQPVIMEGVLELITRVMIDFGRACLEAGADGLFIASQHSTISTGSDDVYRRFILPYDLKMVSQLRGKARFIVMHLHSPEEGDEIRFERIAGFPGVDAINWDDQNSKPSLKEGKQISRKTVLGGMDHSGVLRNGRPDMVKEQVLGAVRHAGLRSLIVAPGCVITTDTPAENIHAAVNAVRSIDPTSKEWRARE